MSQRESHTYTERQPAKRVFATEYQDATHEVESRNDVDARQVLLPTGVWAHRVFVVGTLVSRNRISDQYVTARVKSPTGELQIDAGEYTPTALNRILEFDLPSLVGITGKARTYTTDRGVTRTKIRVEQISGIHDPLYERWINNTANQTLTRINAFDPNENDAAQTAIDQYDVDLTVYKQSAIDAIEKAKEEIKSDISESNHSPS